MGVVFVCVFPVSGGTQDALVVIVDMSTSSLDIHTRKR